jgi:hypothetical protein
MENMVLPAFDAVEVTGLSVILDEGDLPPFLNLRMRCGDKTYRVGVLAVEEDWAINIHDEDGGTVFDEGGLFPTQSSAVLGAMLAVIDAARTFPSSGR